MKIYELETKNGRVYKVAIANKNQELKFRKTLRENEKKSYEVFTKVKCIYNSIHDINDFINLANKLV